MLRVDRALPGQRNPAPIVRQAMRGARTHGAAHSNDYEVSRGGSDASNLNGGRAREVAERQQSPFASVIQQWRDGKPRGDFTALADAIKSTGLSAGSVLEV